MSLEDREYIEGILEGRSELFEALVRKYNRLGGAIAYGIVGDFQRAEDVCQDAFLKAYRSLARLRDPKRFKHWFSEIVRSTALDSLRRRRETPVGEIHDDFAQRAGFRSVPSVEDEQIEAEARQKILEAVAELPEEDRTVLVLKHMEGLSYKEIAELAGTTVSAVESRLFRARSALRKKLKPTRSGRGGD